MSGSDDDVPLGLRPLSKPAAPLSDDSDGNSPVPSWIAEFQSPSTARPAESSDDELIDQMAPAVTQPAEQLVEQDRQEHSSKTKPHAKQHTLVRRKVIASQATSAFGSQAGISQPLATQGSTPSQPATQPMPGSAKRRQGPIVKETGVVAAADTVDGQMAVVLPDKMSKARWLVELEPDDAGATDLAGDAGAVGRFTSITAADGKSREMQLDLKGVIYGASVMPAASTLFVVNMGVSEAKVEAILDCYIQLREEARPGQDGGAEHPKEADYFLWDADDHYQMSQADDGAPKANGKRKQKEGQPVKRRKQSLSKLGVKGGTAKPKAARKGGGKGASFKRGKKK